MTFRDKLSALNFECPGESQQETGNAEEELGDSERYPMQERPVSNSPGQLHAYPFHRASYASFGGDRLWYLTCLEENAQFVAVEEANA